MLVEHACSIIGFKADNGVAMFGAVTEHEALVDTITVAQANAERCRGGWREGCRCRKEEESGDRSLECQRRMHSRGGPHPIYHVILVRSLGFVLHVSTHQSLDASYPGQSTDSAKVPQYSGRQLSPIFMMIQSSLQKNLL